MLPSSLLALTVCRCCLCEQYSLRLQQEGLTVSTAPDDEFEAESDDGEGDGSS